MLGMSIARIRPMVCRPRSRRALDAAWHAAFVLAAAILSVLPGVAGAADAGTVTILDGTARMLRATSWFKLAEGARLQDGDVLDVPERTQVQIELGGGIFNLVGPTQLLLAPVREAKGPAVSAIEIAMAEGWAKFAAKGPAGTLRVRAPTVGLVSESAVAVIHPSGDAFEAFVESGTVKLADIAKGAKAGPPIEARADEYWSREAGKPLVAAKRPPRTFVSAMPRHFVDPLPSRAAKFEKARVTLAPAGEVTYAEAAPWLAGPYRRLMLPRFQPKLKDAAFRQSVEQNIRLYPEWDRILHPEKYEPKYEAKPLNK